MRINGRAERALEMKCRRSPGRHAFGRRLADQGVIRERVAQFRILIKQARWLVLNAAWKMAKAGNQTAKREIAMIKVAAPAMALQVIDWAMQLHGGGSMCEDLGLARAYASTRAIRFADGPDEVHRNAIAKTELGWSEARREGR
jgi:acyl-CoA dehydrogenase